jgi:hypothetical protein
MKNDNNHFVDPTRLTKWVRIALYFQLVIAVVAIVTDYREIQLVRDIQVGDFATEQEMNAAIDLNEDWQSGRAGIEILVFVVSGILILKWIYRANHNARQLGASNMRFSPGWSVGWFFVPIALLWKPYQAMKEIWRASHKPDDWQNYTSYGFVGLWWFVWLFSRTIDVIASRVYDAAEEMEEIARADWLYIFSYLIGAILTIVTLKLINRIYRAQMSQIERAPDSQLSTSSNLRSET